MLQIPTESFVTNMRIYLFCAGIRDKCKPRNEGCQKNIWKHKINPTRLIQPTQKAARLISGYVS